jgi:hypothetical protein
MHSCLLTYLRISGVKSVGEGVKHIHFVGLDRDAEKNYGASIPAELALSPEKVQSALWRKERTHKSGRALTASLIGCVAGLHHEW